MRIAVVDVPEILFKNDSNINTGLVKEHEEEIEKWKILNCIWGPCTNRLAFDCVTIGPDEALTSVPVANFQELRTFDRPEMESYRSIRNLIKEYLNNPYNTKPLSIAIFGSPGSGKSFGIKQIMIDISQEQNQKAEITQKQTEILEFNLAQFNEPIDLISIFHLVRDVTMRDKMPVVFFDEFDSTLGQNAYGWLRYFLYPMQDGLFVDNNITHPIGKAIFVFAGGIIEKFEDLDFSSNNSKKKRKKLLATFKDAKGPDFVSRLMGYVNITGFERPSDHNPKNEAAFMIKRALVIRRHLEKYYMNLFTGKQLNIDGAVLNAFLNVNRFKHGLRSITAIIDMSALSERSRFEVSSLPPRKQLQLHVNADEFYGLIRNHEDLVINKRMLKANQTLNKALAKWINAINREYCIRDFNEKINLITEAINESKEEQTVTLIDPRGVSMSSNSNQKEPIEIITDRLSIINCYITNKDNDKGKLFYGATEDEYNWIGRKDHEMWLRSMEKAGWKYGVQTDQAKKINQNLVPWEDLDGNIKTILKCQISNLPLFLRVFNKPGQDVQHYTVKRRDI